MKTAYIVRLVGKRDYNNEYVGTYNADSADSAVQAALNDPYIRTIPRIEKLQIVAIAA